MWIFGQDDVTNLKFSTLFHKKREYTNIQAFEDLPAFQITIGQFVSNGRVPPAIMIPSVLVETGRVLEVGLFLFQLSLEFVSLPTALIPHQNLAKF